MTIITVIDPKHDVWPVHGVDDPWEPLICDACGAYWRTYADYFADDDACNSAWRPILL